MFSKARGTSTLPACFTLAARRTSLFNATEASASSLPISATSALGCADWEAGVAPPIGATPATSCGSAPG
jgi:hypothetical protein